MPALSMVQTIAVWVLPVLLAVTMHEAAHAFVANRCGDSTAKMLGRLSLNPLRHVDMMGTFIVPILIGILSQFQFVFGWAKPVPINGSRLHKPRRDMALVALAGPLSNFIMAILWAVVLKLSTFFHPITSYPALFFFLMARAGIFINLVLGLLNLIPIPPLDGSRVMASLLPPSKAIQYLKLERFGFFILIALMFTGVLSTILEPLLRGALQLIETGFKL